MPKVNLARTVRIDMDSSLTARITGEYTDSLEGWNEFPVLEISSAAWVNARSDAAIRFYGFTSTDLRRTAKMLLDMAGEWDKIEAAVDTFEKAETHLEETLKKHDAPI